MTVDHGPATIAPRAKTPVVRPVSFNDITAALHAGWCDFRRAPLFGLFFGGFYAVGGIVILSLMIWANMVYMLIPLIIGFILIGPFVAVGLYEVSRALEEGRPLTWSGVLGVMLQQRTREFSWMAFATLFVFWIWIYQVRLWLAIFFGMKTFSTFYAFLTLVLTTANGLAFFAVGTIVGAILAFLLYSITVVSFPLLLDRDVDFITAMITSVKTVFTSPAPMLLWGLIIMILVMVAAIPAFLGLLIVLPVLGHASWHLYRNIIVEKA
jgi:uncharacterized membrane protein